MKIIDGKVLGENIKKSLSNKISKTVIKPKLVIIQIGDNKSSNIYISRKIKFGQEIGVEVEILKFSDKEKEEKIINTIKKLNSDKTINGIIVQLPIPKKINQTRILDIIDPAKDVDGIGKYNFANLIRGKDAGEGFFVPATTRGIFEIFKKHKIIISGKKVVFIGRSNLVGKPTIIHLINNDATVTVCHSKTKKLSSITKNADIIITATGHHGILNYKNTSKKQIIIDVGIAFNEKDRLVGDVDHRKLAVSAITKVPGGVGPMTVASLFLNLFEAFCEQNNVGV